jgi:hypothetical protein
VMETVSSKSICNYVDFSVDDLTPITLIGREGNKQRRETTLMIKSSAARSKKSTGLGEKKFLRARVAAKLWNLVLG